MLAKTIVGSALSLCIGAAFAQSTDPNIAGLKENSKIERKSDLRMENKDTRAAPGADPTERNKKYADQKKKDEEKATSKAAAQSKIDKKKESEE